MIENCIMDKAIKSRLIVVIIEIYNIGLNFTMPPHFYITTTCEKQNL